jgi:hypothetical protein
MSCVDPSVRIVTKSPKVGPLLIFSISLGGHQCCGSGLIEFGSGFMLSAEFRASTGFYDGNRKKSSKKI